jgi:hypothetical protein
MLTLQIGMGLLSGFEFCKIVSDGAEVYQLQDFILSQL